MGDQNPVRCRGAKIGKCQNGKYNFSHILEMVRIEYSKVRERFV